MKLSFGAGERRSEGFVHLDARPLDGIDIVHEWRPDNPLPLQHDTVSVLLALDCIEHFDPRERVALITDWRRVLAPGGELILCTPDLLRTARKLVHIVDHGVLSGDERLGDNLWWQEEIARHIYCLHNHEWNRHKSGSTPQTIRAELERHGFTVDRIKPATLHFGNMLVYARKGRHNDY